MNYILLINILIAFVVLTGIVIGNLLMLNKMQKNNYEINQNLRRDFESIVENIDRNLQANTTNVEKKLNEESTKSQTIFTNISQRLAVIDSAQKRLTDLSGDVLSLQEILIDKRARGAFGELQLENLVCDLIPKTKYLMQHVLPNGTRCDCFIKLPEPTGNLIIDAKFPLENYKKFVDFNLADEVRAKGKTAFKLDLKKHIQDIASKYIIPGITSDGAMMFIPSEAIFAEVHVSFPEVVDFAHTQHVWLASPTTMMAILTTASSVLKHDATKEHVKLIKQNIQALNIDFMRFIERMSKLERHIDQAQEDVKKVNTSAHKITSRFEQIQQVEISPETLES